MSASRSSLSSAHSLDDGAAGSAQGSRDSLSRPKSSRKVQFNIDYTPATTTTTNFLSDSPVPTTATNDIDETNSFTAAAAPTEASAVVSNTNGMCEYVMPLEFFMSELRMGSFSSRNNILNLQVAAVAATAQEFFLPLELTSHELGDIKVPGNPVVEKILSPAEYVDEQLRELYEGSVEMQIPRSRPHSAKIIAAKSVLTDTPQPLPSTQQQGQQYQMDGELLNNLNSSSTNGKNSREIGNEGVSPSPHPSSLLPPLSHTTVANKISGEAITASREEFSLLNIGNNTTSTANRTRLNDMNNNRATTTPTSR